VIENFFSSNNITVSDNAFFFFSLQGKTIDAGLLLSPVSRLQKGRRFFSFLSSKNTAFSFFPPFFAQ